MHSDYFVLITDENFGIFEISAETYPQEFLENLINVSVIKGNMLENFLIEKLGRNILINKNFSLFTGIGNLYSRHPS
jgi:hypothetical protein